MFVGFRIKHWAAPLIAAAGLVGVAVAKSDFGKVIGAAGKGAWQFGCEKFRDVQAERRAREAAYQEFASTSRRQKSGPGR